MKETHVHVLEDGTVLEHTHGEQEHVHTHAVSYTHLDVYKRQLQSAGRLQMSEMRL